jgi:hypothetical protein
MAHWGIAMTLFQPLWPTRPTEADLERGREAVARARTLGAGTERERLLVAAAGAFFDAEQSDYWDRIARWADATRVLYERFPDDTESAAFFALAHLAVAPARGAGQHNEESAAVLQSLLRVAPDHPGAVHYMIHANDADGRAGESPDVVRNYTAIAPHNPHALHMPFARAAPVIVSAAFSTGSDRADYRKRICTTRCSPSTSLTCSWNGRPSFRLPRAVILYMPRPGPSGPDMPKMSTSL